MIIYRAYNTVNGKSYIGQTTQRFKHRISQHYCNAFRLNKDTHFCKALRKYGKKSFEWSILSKANSKEELDELEKKYIIEYNTYEHGYNLTVGGEGTVGFKTEEETKAKISKATTGEKNPNSKINVDKVIKIKELLRDTNLLYSQIAEIVGVNKINVSNIYYGKNWTSVNVEGFKPFMFRDIEENNRLNSKKNMKVCNEKTKKKLTPSQIKEIRQKIKEKIPYKQIGVEYGVSAGTICLINKGKIYKDV